MNEKIIPVKVKYTSEGGEAAVSQWKEVMKGMISGEAVIRAAEKAFDLLKDVVVESIKAYDDQVVAMERLKSTFGEGAEGLNKFAESQSKLTRNSKDSLLAATNTLAMHKLNSSEIKKLLPVIEDYAAKSGKDLTETAYAFSKAIEYGTTKGLRPYGLEIDKTGSQQKIFNDLINAGQGDAKGMAETLGEVGSGPLEQVKNQFRKMAETIGGMLNPVVSGLAKFLRDDLNPVLQEFLGGGHEKAVESEKKHIIELQQDYMGLKIALALAEKTGKSSFATMTTSGQMLTHTIGEAKAELKMLQEDIKKGDKLFGAESPEKSKLGAKSEEDIKKQKEANSKLLSFAKKFSEESIAEVDATERQKIDIKEKSSMIEAKQLGANGKIIDQIQRYYYQERLALDKKESDEGQKIVDERTKKRRETEKKAQEKLLQEKEHAEEKAENFRKKSLSKTYVGQLKLLKEEHNKEKSELQKFGLSTVQLEEAYSDERKRIAQAEFQYKSELYLETASMVVGALSQVAEASKADAETRRDIAYGDALVNAAGAAIKALNAPFPLNWIQEAAIIASTGAQLSKISQQKFATGGDFITSGPQSIMVGDNAGGRERVQVTPLSSPNINGPQSNDNSLHIHLNPSMTVMGSMNKKTMRKMNQQQQDSANKGVKQAVRELSARGKLSGVKLYN